MLINHIHLRQIAKCRKYGAPFYPTSDHLKVGIADNVNKKNYPINGLRHIPEGDTSGWYIWSGVGELSKDVDYFKPLHISHLHSVCPDIVQFLGLPPGWRFLIAPGYEDVWFDENLVK